MPSKQYITVQEANELSTYNREYLRQLLRAGKIKGQQVGPTWLINRASLLRYIHTHGQSTDKRLAKF